MRNASALCGTLEKFTHSDFNLPILLLLGPERKTNSVLRHALSDGESAPKRSASSPNVVRAHLRPTDAWQTRFPARMFAGSQAKQ